jgi:hypothetical protein
MKRMALIAGAIAGIMLIPLGFIFPDKIGTISIVGVAFILLCLFMYIVFRNYE